MADTNATISIQNIVDRFLFKYKISKDDYFLFQEHAYDCTRDLNLFHGKFFSTSRITTDSLGRADMPDDCEDVISLSQPWNGMKWTFTRRPDMSISFTGAGSTVDDDFGTGEGLGIADDRTFGYGAHGGVNHYYWKDDWRNRKIYIDSLLSDDFLLTYISSGISLTISTVVPAKATFVYDAFLRWKQSEFDMMPYTEQNMRKDSYDDAIMMLRKTNMPGAIEFKDILRQLTVQSIIR